MRAERGSARRWCRCTERNGRGDSPSVCRVQRVAARARRGFGASCAALVRWYWYRTHTGTPDGCCRAAGFASARIRRTARSGNAAGTRRRGDLWREIGRLAARNRYRRHSRANAYRCHWRHYVEADVESSLLRPRAAELADAAWFAVDRLPSDVSDALDVALRNHWLGWWRPHTFRPGRIRSSRAETLVPVAPILSRPSGGHLIERYIDRCRAATARGRSTVADGQSLTDTA